MEELMPDDASSAAANKQQRDQSTIQFPYGDLDDAIEVAEGLMKRGGVACEPDQLAAAMGQAPTSGNFRTKIATARIFGLIETVQGKYQLTDLGFGILDKGRAAAAKAESFLKVPLYRKLYEDFRNRQLPPRATALEQTFVTFGVAPKQKVRARQAFDRSAQQAGFFGGGNDRLIRPTTASLTVENPALEEVDAVPLGDGSGAGVGGRNGNGGGGYSGPSRYHPFIEGLLQTLPEPGTLWTIEGRAAWLQAAAQNFTLIYKGEGKIDVQAVSAQRSPA
jgi:hypothetical protein